MGDVCEFMILRILSKSYLVTPVIQYSSMDSLYIRTLLYQ